MILDPQRDSYTSWNHFEDDRGYHYAIISAGSPLNTPPGCEGSHDERARLTMLAQAEHIPLPMLVERLGYVRPVDPSDIEDLHMGLVRDLADIETEVTLEFIDVLRLLMRLFDGNVKIAMRYEWDRFFNRATGRDPETEEEEELAKSVVMGPYLPRSWDDEERIALLQQWLLEKGMELGESGKGKGVVTRLLYDIFGPLFQE